MRLSDESYRRSSVAGDNYNFAEQDRQAARGQRLRNTARQIASRNGVTTNELGRITGGQWRQAVRSALGSNG